MRTNGFEAPHNAMQISTWIILPILIFHFALFVTPTLPYCLSIPFSILFYTLAGASAYYTYVTTKTDSMDERLYEHLRGKPHPNVLKRKEKKDKQLADDANAKKNTSVEPSGATSVESTGVDDTKDEDKDEEEQDEEVKYCWVCQTEVHVHSMHCKYCDKCVSHFDHHCMWLNTCIGEANYGTFLRSVWCLTLLNIVHLLALILYYIGYFTNSWNIRERSEYMKEGSPEIIMGINLGVGAFVFAVVAMVVQLLMFHQALIRDGLTTYQFIMKDSQLKRDKMVYNTRLKERRNLELSKIQAEKGSSVRKTLIKIGGMKLCRPCDPIRKMLVEEKAIADSVLVPTKSTDDDFLETPSPSQDGQELITYPNATHT